MFPPQSEDAFFLNLWAPDNAQGLPVLVFIHGGAWMSGGGSMPWYDGTHLAAQGMVVVNVNYRIGPFGHLCQAEAHPLPVPATDLLLALQWVGEHIHRFGGNAAKTTVMGQSAGGWYAHLLSVLPQTQGWFQRVALLSMGTRSPWTPAQQRETTDRALALALAGGLRPGSHRSRAESRHSGPGQGTRPAGIRPLGLFASGERRLTARPACPELGSSAIACGCGVPAHHPG